MDNDEFTCRSRERFVQAAALVALGVYPSQNEVGRKRKKEKKKSSALNVGMGIWEKLTFFFREKKDILLDPGRKRDGMAEKGWRERRERNRGLKRNV